MNHTAHKLALRAILPTGRHSDLPLPELAPFVQVRPACNVQRVLSFGRPFSAVYSAQSWSLAVLGRKSPVLALRKRLPLPQGQRNCRPQKLNRHPNHRTRTRRQQNRGEASRTYPLPNFLRHCAKDYFPPVIRGPRIYLPPPRRAMETSRYSRASRWTEREDFCWDRSTVRCIDAFHFLLIPRDASSEWRI